MCIYSERRLRSTVEVRFTELFGAGRFGAEGLVAARKTANAVEAPLLVQVEEEDQQQHHEGSYGAQERRRFHRN